MNLIESYLRILQEGYLLSDQTISFDLNKFENGESNILLIVGLIGSGKSTLATYVAEKYNAQILQRTDECISWSLDEHPPNEKQFKSYINCTKNMLATNKKSVIEGVGILSLLNMGHKTVLNYPMIIIGKSTILSSYQAFVRNIKKEKEQVWKMLFTQTKMNINLFQKQINDLRKEREKIPGTVVKVFDIPKL